MLLPLPITSALNPCPLVYPLCFVYTPHVLYYLHRMATALATLRLCLHCIYHTPITFALPNCFVIHPLHYYLYPPCFVKSGLPLLEAYCLVILSISYLLFSYLFKSEFILASEEVHEHQLSKRDYCHFYTFAFGHVYFYWQILYLRLVAKMDSVKLQMTGLKPELAGGVKTDHIVHDTFLDQGRLWIRLTSCFKSTLIAENIRY